MPNLVRVNLDERGGSDYFRADGLEPKVGEAVVVETEWGTALGHVLRSYKPVSLEEVKHPVRNLLRRALPSDLEAWRTLGEREEQAAIFCRRRIKERGLPMKLSTVRISLDGSKAIFYFTAEGRVDFRELVRDLARELKMRIELRQIGPRDEARLLGCVGPCGRELCCKHFLQGFQSIAMKMAKVQDFSLDPDRLSGACGRLKCCLAYEYRIYEALKKGLPKLGSPVDTPEGPGVVRGHEVLKEAILVRLEGGGERQYLLAELRNWALKRWGEEGPPSCGGGCASGCGTP